MANVFLPKIAKVYAEGQLPGDCPTYHLIADCHVRTVMPIIITIIYVHVYTPAFF